MKRTLYGIVLISVLVWIISLIVSPPARWDVWQIRQQFILVTGIIAFGNMSLIMLLAARPQWMENFFGGLDKMYILHKWGGILSIIFGGIHYLIDLSGPNLLSIFFGISPHREDFFYGLAENLGEWVVGFLLVSLALTLWTKLSYYIWRYVHKLMSIAFLILVFHAIVLSPVSYWTQPAGIFIGLCCLVGSVSALISLFGLIGKQNTFKGEIIDLKNLNSSIIEIVCKVEGNWKHTAGQYVFFKHNKTKEAHPFTLASADKDDGVVHLCVKDLGDYTHRLQTCLRTGDLVTIEGPYGRFDFRKNLNPKQIWIAAGIGVTPFIAWLESLENDPNREQYDVDLYYCVNNEKEAVFGERLRSLTELFFNIRLHLYYSDEKGFLTLDHLDITKNKEGDYPPVWFCGPEGFADFLKHALIKKGLPKKIFHRELFRMR
ncbi:MAG: ferric reductase-like transmembrane domain-containing protein [Flavobacteriaceae bacterium]|jgi:predicted ferric reductase|nr:ferric reductase-like transmembrane domain-containing protein [Flavobacteriaceae bacterium]